VVEPDRLVDEAQALAEQLAGRAPLAVAAIRRAVAAGLDRPLEAGLLAERSEFEAVSRTADAQEGISAFVHKRAPEWSGH
jgi:enoyl-CoA hydratase